MWHLHPGRMVEVPERQLLTYVSAGAGVVVYVVVPGRGGFYRVELSVIRTPPRTISCALSFDLWTALTRSHGSDSVKSAGLIHFQLVREILGTCDHHVSLVSMIEVASEMCP